jgi:ectoine hydroxylase-related dioxygenase (phytanoyl-CoA dioxygenase family)
VSPIFTDLARQFDELETRGFTIVPGVVGKDEAAVLKEQLRLALKKDWEEFGGRPGKVPHLVVELVLRDAAFRRLLDNDLMHAVFERLLGKDCILYCFNSAIMPPKQQTAACEIHTDQNFWIPGYVSRILMTLALDDFTEENGATYHMPRSHLLEHAPPPEVFYREAVRVVRNAGDAVFFNSRCWHAGAVNHTSAVRYAIGLQACRHFMKQRFDYPRMLPEDVVAGLSERARRFLGFYSRPPESQDEFYRPPSERTYRAGAGQSVYDQATVALAAHGA